MRSATPAQQQPCTIATASARRNLCRVVQATVCCLAEQAAGLALMGPSLCMQPGLVEGDNCEEATDHKSIKALLNKLRPEKFGKLFSDMVAVGYDHEQTVAGLVDQVLPHFTI